MAQRASNVSWNGNYVFGSDTLLSKPEHAAWVAAGVAAWAATEEHLGRVFGSLIGAKQPVTLSMYTAIRSPEVQRDIVKAACVELLPKRYAMLAAACLEQLYKISKERHQFAHWIWGMSADPALNALLLVEPRHFWMLHAARTRHWRKNANMGLSLLRQPHLSHEDIWVYKLSDLKDVHQRMDRAYQIADALERLVASSSNPRRQAIYRMLSGQPDIQSALTRVKRNWPSSRPTRALPPRKAPRK
jgi:hypothetical protein